MEKNKRVLLKLRQLIKNYPYLKRTITGVKKLYYGYIKTLVKKDCYCNFSRHIIGLNNTIIIKRGCRFANVQIRIIGNNNKISFGENVSISKRCSFWMEGDNIEITIGDNTSFNHTCHLCAQENSTKISIGSNCMFSNNIIVRTSDSHPIFDTQSGKRINMAKSVYIGDNVWIAAHVTILKGVKINDGSILGFGSIVSKDIQSNCIAVGTPARAVKENVCWRRTFNE